MTNLKYQISKYKWGLIAAGVVVAVIVVFMATRQRDKTWVQVRQSGVVRFGMDASYPPFDGLLASGEFVGLDVELARELAQRMGLRAEFTSIGSDGLYDALTTGRCDAVISALVPDAGRTQDFRYTTPYFDSGLVLVVPVTSTLDNLKGRTLAVERGSEGDVRARWLARRTLGLRLLTYDTSGEAMRAVETGLADAALTDTATAREYVAAHPALRIGPRQTSSPYVIATHISAPELARALEQALAQVKADGALERILARWLDQAR